MRLFIGLLSLLLLVFLVPVTGATSTISLSTAVVPVADRSSSAQQVAIKAAFNQIVVKITGNPAAVDVPAIRQAAAQAEQWVQSYQYLNLSSDASSLQLAVTFDEVAVANWLVSQQQALWSAERPQVLVSVYAPMVTPLVNQPPDSLLLAITATAKQRGLPLLFPNIDSSEDLIRPVDVWTAFPDDQSTPLPSVVQTALLLQPAWLELQQQYATDGFLVAQVMTSAAPWQVEWLFGYQQSFIAWQDVGNDWDGLAQRALSRAIEQILHLAKTSETNKQGESAVSQLQLAFTGINDLNDFDQILKYLKSLPMVEDAQISDTSNDSLLLNIRLNNSSQSLLDILNHNPQLISLPAKPGSTILYYHWLGPNNPEALPHASGTGYTTLPSTPSSSDLNNVPSNSSTTP